LEDVQRENYDIKCRSAKLQKELTQCKLTNEENTKEINTQRTMPERLTEENAELVKTSADGEALYNDLKKQVEKVQQEKAKLVMDYEARLVNIDAELKKSYAKVDKIYKENVTLAEEKKVL
jgi:predicted patatin/cPLA2 family phospholipase